LVRKSHKDSEAKNLEWRLSFSVVEKEIIKEIPEIPKRAFMICKELMAYKMFQKLYGNYSDASKQWKSFFLKENPDIGINVRKVLFKLEGVSSYVKIDKISKKIKEEYGPLTTYHWKTATLRKMDESWGNAELGLKDLYNMVRELIEFVLDAVKAESMNNYFVPGMNLYYKFTKKQEEGQFKRSKELLEEMLDDFSETIRTLVFSKNYNVNFEGEGKRYHLLAYQKFDKFHQRIDDIPNFLLLEGYFTFLTSLFTPDLKHPRDWVVNKKENENTPKISVKHTYFLMRMANHLGLVQQQDLPDSNSGFGSLILKLLNTFPLTIFASVPQEEGKLELFIGFFNDDPKFCDGNFMKIINDGQFKSNLGRLFLLTQHFPAKNRDISLKESVGKYITENGEINIFQLERDILEFVSENKHHKFCEKICGFLKQFDFEQIMTLFQRFSKNDSCDDRNWKLPMQSDLTSTPVNLFLKILRVGLEEENRHWKMERDYK